jgi:ANTAR domain
MLALLLPAPDTEEFLRELAALATRQIGAGLSCQVTLQPGRPPGRGTLAGRPGEQPGGADDDRGPDASSAGQLASGANTAGRPAGSSLSVPMTSCGQPFAELALSAPAARALGQAEVRRAEAFAATASHVLALAVRQAEQAELTRQLRAGLRSRAVIDQAPGIIMAQERCTSAAAAFRPGGSRLRSCPRTQWRPPVPTLHIPVATVTETRATVQRRRKRITIAAIRCRRPLPDAPATPSQPPASFAAAARLAVAVRRRNSATSSRSVSAYPAQISSIAAFIPESTR